MTALNPTAAADVPTPPRPACPSWCVQDHATDRMPLDWITDHYGEMRRVLTTSAEFGPYVKAYAIWHQFTDPREERRCGSGPRVVVVGYEHGASVQVSPKEAEGLARVLEQLGHTAVAEIVRAAAADIGGAA
ncbi:DUF6907 domain-containing protein [Actinomadura hibisca]|uniref:DUF6907 domain-containing protein n=1 Tax=Actinomadura hibisca TaxID=68565 RepID=UPI00082D0E4C|nr:hypothetical protein [Actinomadura hibisca]